MIVTTTQRIEGKKVVRYIGVVSGEAIMGTNIFKDFFAGIRDIVGGRSAAYEKELKKAKDISMGEMMDEAERMGANAIIGIDLDYESIQINNGGNMMMVAANGTAVVVEEE